MRTAQRHCSGDNTEFHTKITEGFKVEKPKDLDAEMQECFTKLKELVPSVPQNKKVSKVQILQHVIDYILDLEIALDSQSSLHDQLLTPTPRKPLVETTQSCCNNQDKTDLIETRSSEEFVHRIQPNTT